MKPNTEEKFWNTVDRSNIDGCWLWLGWCSQYGYGETWFGNRCWKAHRLAWAFIHGDIPEGMHILHHCDNKSCVNPKHLFCGTNADNMADRNAKGRQARGERVNTAKLTSDQVQTIYARYHSKGISQRELADEYGVVTSNIGYIVRQETWKHLWTKNENDTSKSD